MFELLSESNTEKDFNEKFSLLETNTLELLNFYQEILSKFKENGEIFYSKEFLSLNEKCKSLRGALERSYPTIRRAYDVITDDDIDDKFKLEFKSKIGTGITHIRKFYKIKLYAEKHSEQLINPLNLRAYYRVSTEYIFVESKSEVNAINYITALERILNQDSYTTEKIGKVNINPIYDFISLGQDKYTEISYVIVYPNGNPSLERHDILQQSEAKEIHIKLYSPDGKYLISEPVEQELNEKAKKGYLKSLFVKGNKKSGDVIKKIKEVVSMNITL